MLGYSTSGAAVTDYMRSFDPPDMAEQIIRGVDEMTMEQFKGWIASGDTVNPRFVYTSV